MIRAVRYSSFSVAKSINRQIATMEATSVGRMMMMMMIFKCSNPKLSVGNEVNLL
jgi:hypothetical protein